MEEGKVRYQDQRHPQGGVISPLLANIYIYVTPLDHGLSEAGFVHVQYADDVLILCHSREEAEAALAKAKELLKMLKLRLSEEATKVNSFAEGLDFLGFHFTARHVGVGKKSRKGFHAKIHTLTRRQQGALRWRRSSSEAPPAGGNHRRGWMRENCTSSRNGGLYANKKRKRPTRKPPKWRLVLGLLGARNYMLAILRHSASGAERSGGGRRGSASFGSGN